jgi:hypothetical protein
MKRKQNEGFQLKSNDVLLLNARDVTTISLRILQEISHNPAIILVKHTKTHRETSLKHSLFNSFEKFWNAHRTLSEGHCKAPDAKETI